MTVNEASIMLRLGPVKLIGGLEHRYDGIYQNGFVDRFHTLFALAELQGEISDLELNARGRLGLSGYNPGDYLLKANLGWRTDLLKLKAGIHSSLTEAAFLAQKIISFPRTWENDLKKISINSLEFSAAIESDLQYLSAEFIISNYLNLVYYTNNGWVQQEQQSVQHIQSSLIYKLKWKPLSFELKLINQELSNQNVLPRPQWSADGKLYSNLLIFKKKLNIQIGFEGYWFSDFKAPEYIPFIRQWGISDSMFSSYPPVQFFLNARVQSLNFGISVFHVQEQVMGTRFYSSPAYPMLPRLFRLNILWDLKN
jgi:hypothetical protein